MNVFFSANLMGGLGNQMFQISHALSQSWKHNVDCFFEPYSQAPMQAFQPTKYENNIFRNVTFKKITEPTNTVIESHWNDPQITFNPNENTLFCGYYQSEKNFLEYNNKIKNFFHPTDEFKEKILNLYPEIEKSISVSLHIRRGDYLTIPDVLPPQSLDYYNNCLSMIGEFDFVYIFSDDKQWAIDNFKNEKYIVVTNLDDYEELWMMSLCSNNIISNSTFSWWGSYLNLNENKKVFAPKIWFGPNGPNPYDSIYLNNWILI